MKGKICLENFLQKYPAGQSCVSSHEQIDQSAITRNMKNQVHIKDSIPLNPATTVPVQSNTPTQHYQ